jgi:hypothetical protein
VLRRDVPQLDRIDTEAVELHHLWLPPIVHALPAAVSNGPLPP